MLNKAKSLSVSFHTSLVHGGTRVNYFRFSQNRVFAVTVLKFSLIVKIREMLQLNVIQMLMESIIIFL